MDLFTSTQEPTRMCAHIHANPLILPPVLLSISAGSGVAGVDGCWQELDCGGKDDGSSCRDRIAVSWDLLEGVIRLLWSLLPIRPSLQRAGGRGGDSADAVQAQNVDPLPSSYSFLLSHTNTCTSPRLRAANCIHSRFITKRFFFLISFSKTNHLIKCHENDKNSRIMRFGVETNIRWWSYDRQERMRRRRRKQLQKIRSQHEHLNAKNPSVICDFYVLHHLPAGCDGSFSSVTEAKWTGDGLFWERWI